MANEDTTLQQRIQDEKSKVQVDNYHDIAFEGTWRGRSRGFWGVGALGLMAGAAIGLVAPIFPVIVGAQSIAAATALIPTSMAIFSATGLGMGVAAGTMVGASSGAVGAVAKEQEKRLREAGIETTLQNDPQAQINSPDAAQPKANKSFFTRMREAIGTLQFNPKVMLAFGAMGAVAGLVMAAAFMATGGAAAIPAVGTLLGAAASSPPAVATYFAGVMGCLGTLFGMNLPKVANELTNVMGDTLGGKTINAPWPKSPQQQVSVPAVQATPEISPATQAAAKPAERNFQPSNSYQEMLAKKAAEQSSDLSLKA